MDRSSVSCCQQPVSPLCSTHTSHDNKTVSMKPRHLSDTTYDKEEMFQMFFEWMVISNELFSHFCFTLPQEVSFTVLYVLLSISKVAFFKGNTSSYEFASLLAPLLCHCNFTVGFKAFGGLHSNENSFTTPLCWVIVGHPYLPAWIVLCSLLLWA